MGKKIIIPILFLLVIICAVYILTTIPLNKNGIEKIEDEWDLTFGGEKNEEGYFVFSTDDKGCVITGYTESYGSGNKDLLIIKYDQYGNEKWNLTVGGDENESGKALIQTEDKGYLLIGNTDSYGYGEKDVLLVKINKDGEKQWDKTFGGEKNDRGNSIEKTDDGGYIIVGRSESFGNKDYDILIIKINDLGEEQWIKTMGGKKDDEARSIVKNNKGEYIIASSTRSYGKGRTDIWLMKINNSGEEKWNKTFGYENSDIPNQIIKTKNNSYITVGHSELNYSNRWSGLIIKVDEQGNKIWEKTIENKTTDVGVSSIAKTNDGYISTGYKGPYGEEQDQLLLKVDLNGNEIWRRNLGGEYCDAGVWIQKSTNEYYFITGYRDTDGSGIYDLWLVKNKIN